MLKRLITTSLIIACCILPLKAFAALSAQTNWDVATTGATTGGGGFVASPHTSVPSAPTVNATGNGSVALDEYYVVVTYTDAYGETAASAETYVNVTSTSNDTIVVTSPAASTNAVQYKTYIGTVSGGQYYYQAATNIGTNYSRTTTPATTGDQPSGTDYSQADAANDSGTDLACADGDAFVLNTSPVITSATHNFVPADVGNIINITETGDGFTLGRYEIVGVDGSNGALLDRAVGTDGAKTGGDWYLGGRVDHPNTISAVVVAGNIIHIKSGVDYVKVGENTYVLTISVAGGNSKPIKWIGYQTSHLDYPTTTGRPIFNGDSDANATADTTNCLVLGTVGANVFQDIIFKLSTTSNISSGTVSGDNNFFKNCKISEGTLDGYGTTSSTGFFNCEVGNNGDSGILSSGGRIYFCYIHDNSNMGLVGSVTTSFHTLEFSIADSNTGDGFQVGHGSLSFGSVSYNNSGATADGFNFRTNSTSAFTQNIIFNNSSINNGQYGFVDESIATFKYFSNNNYNGNGTGGVEKIILEQNNNTTAPTFTDATTGDFTITSADTALKGTGFMQSATNGLTGDYQWNIGVDQDDNAAAGTGGGASFFSMN